MNLFVYEHITSGALIDQELPASLAHEGDEMLFSVLRDCDALPNLQLSILRDARLTNLDIFDGEKHHHCHIISDQTGFQQAWKQCLINADSVLIIAPETDNTLATLQQQSIDYNKVILGCLPSAISLSTNKLACAQRLNTYNIPTPESCLASHWNQQKFEHLEAYIIKPIDGAGCLDTLIFDTLPELEHHLSQQHSEALQHSLIQPYIQGIPASLSLLISNDNILVLGINSQNIVRKDNNLIFKGCVVNGIDQAIFSLSDASQLASQIQQAIPGLWGFVGIDLILTDTQVVVIDINPRLTTSYVGLKQSLSLNPMTLLFSLNDGVMPILDTTRQRKHVNIEL